MGFGRRTENVAVVQNNLVSWKSIDEVVEKTLLCGSCAQDFEHRSGHALTGAKINLDTWVKSDLYIHGCEIWFEYVALWCEEITCSVYK